MKQINALGLFAATVVAAGVAVCDTFMIGKDKSDFALAESWEGGVAPGAEDFVNFGVSGFYGPFSLSSDVTYKRFESGGWGLFDSANGLSAQEFNLCGHTMTLAGYRVSDGYVFNPCNSGPRNHFVFSNGKIAIGQRGNITIGWDSGKYSSKVRLSTIELTGPSYIYVGYQGSYDAELKIDNNSVASCEYLKLSNAGVGVNTDKPNRFIVDNARFTAVDFESYSGGVTELTDGADLSVHTFKSALASGLSREIVSNSTLSATSLYATANVEGSTGFTEVAGESGLLTAGELRAGNHHAAMSFVNVCDGATIEGTSAFSVGYDGPAILVISNANLKANNLVIGESANAAGSALQLYGENCTMETTYGSGSSEKDFFGSGGSSLFEIAGGAKINGTQSSVRIGGSSKDNVFAVTGADTVYNSYSTIFSVGGKSTTGNSLEVTDGAVCNLRRLFISGTNTIKVADATVNIAHGDSYHTSFVIGNSGEDGGRLVLAGSAPKINFTGAAFGGIKMCPGTKIIYELPAAPYETVPLDTYWLHMQPDATYPDLPLAEIVLDLSGIPVTHERLKYRILHVQDELGGVNAIHPDVIEKVNNSPEVRAIGGRLSWDGLDLVFNVPDNRGMKIFVR